MASTSSRCSSPRGVTLRMPVVIPTHVNTLLQDSKSWRLIPESTKCNGMKNPCLFYGAIHFVRLFGESIFENRSILSSKRCNSRNSKTVSGYSL